MNIFEFENETAVMYEDEIERLMQELKKCKPGSTEYANLLRDIQTLNKVSSTVSTVLTTNTVKLMEAEDKRTKMEADIELQMKKVNQDFELQMKKVNQDFELQTKKIEADIEANSSKLEAEKTEATVNKLLSVGGNLFSVLIPAVTYAGLTLVGLDFEEHGYISSTFLKTLISKVRPTQK